MWGHFYLKRIVQYFFTWGCMRYLCTESLLPSAHGDQRCHFWEKRGEIAASQHCTVADEVSRKTFLAIFINAYLKKINIRSILCSIWDFFATRQLFILATIELNSWPPSAAGHTLTFDNTSNNPCSKNPNYLLKSWTSVSHVRIWIKWSWHKTFFAFQISSFSRFST